MTIKRLTNTDFSKNEIQNAVMQNLASAPSSPLPGQMYYDTATGKWMYRNASAWIDATARANHSGTQLAATISDLTAAIQAIRLDQMAAPTASVSLNSQKITNLAEPTVSTDAATKNYVDSAVNGTDWKQSVRCATTGSNLAALSGLLTIDGITVVANDRVLVKDQTTGSANGIYLAASGAWTRSLDADANAEVTAGLSVMVTEGTTLADTQWRLTTNDAVVVGTTALVFAQIGAGSSYTAGTGIDITGNTISINPAVTVRKFAQTVGDGSAVSIAVTHSLNTLDVQVQVVEIATGATVECDVVRNTVNQVTVGFTTAPAANTLRVLVQG